ncbi:hypothetical protein Zmor_009686 [Zophobas morio]|uniref:Uncharacterized protein n=1 Tax=Zophobas morio TaxID=2755281 RepID=A0AA38ILS7_9CUCU|nr:hypothetical protein Zmor_009686 [Zophobas morio]
MLDRVIYSEATFIDLFLIKKQTEPVNCGTAKIRAAVGNCRQAALRCRSWIITKCNVVFVLSEKIVLWNNYWVKVSCQRLVETKKSPERIIFFQRRCFIMAFFMKGWRSFVFLNVNFVFDGLVGSRFNFMLA